jgi:hypothetical protein
MKRRTTVKAGSKKGAALSSAIPRYRCPDSVDRTQCVSMSQEQIAATSADRFKKYQILALERWENEGGRITRPDVVAAGHPLIEKD